jgi:hypothetical protein
MDKMPTVTTKREIAGKWKQQERWIQQITAKGRRLSNLKNKND